VINYFIISHSQPVDIFVAGGTQPLSARAVDCPWNLRAVAALLPRAPYQGPAARSASPPSIKAPRSCILTLCAAAALCAPSERHLSLPCVLLTLVCLVLPSRRVQECYVFRSTGLFHSEVAARLLTVLAAAPVFLLLLLLGLVAEAP
jgi:hypothetical protein